MATWNGLKRMRTPIILGMLAVTTLSAIAFVGNAMFGFSTLDLKIFHELEAIRLGANARNTELTGKLDYICFNTDNRAVQTEFREESIRLQNSFSQSIDSCGIEGSCCKLVSDVVGFVGIVKDGQIRCVAIDSFDFYPRGDRPFCARPEKLRVQEKKVSLGASVPGRPGVVTAGRSSFEVWGELDE
jgi:hypothetical protein